MRPLAMFGGTFDPVHSGHLRAAWEAADALDAEVRLVPASVPPHRPQPVATAAQRLALLRAALAGQDRLIIDERELSRKGYSYTIDTLHEIRAGIGSQRPLVLLLGADAYAGLITWQCWRELFELAHIGVLTRPGLAAVLPAELAVFTAARQVEDAASLARMSAGSVLSIPVTPLDISATCIRAELAAGREPRFLVPDALLANPALLAPYRMRREDHSVSLPGA